MKKEVMLLPLTDDESQANCSDKARSDAIAWWFRSEGQWTFFDIGIFDSNSQLYLNKSPRKCYETNEQEKRRKHHKNKVHLHNLHFQSPEEPPKNVPCFQKLNDLFPRKRKEKSAKETYLVRFKLSRSFLWSCL